MRKLTIIPNERYFGNHNGYGVCLYYNDGTWYETDEYDEDVQDYINFEPVYLTDYELRKIFESEIEIYEN